MTNLSAEPQISAETQISADLSYVDIRDVSCDFEYKGISGRGKSFSEAFLNGLDQYSINERLLDDAVIREADYIMEETDPEIIRNYIEYHLEDHWESTRPMPDPSTYVPSRYMLKKFRDSESFQQWCWQEV